VSLSEAGARFYAAAVPILDDLERASSRAGAGVSVTRSALADEHVQRDAFDQGDRIFGAANRRGWQALTASRYSCWYCSGARVNRIAMAGSSGVNCRNPWFAKLCQCRYHSSMSTMNISLPDALKSFVDEQVTNRGFGTSSEYVRELIRKDQDRLHLRGLLLEGGNSKPSAPANAAYFASLRERTKHRARR